MGNSQTTRPSLLVRIRDVQDTTAWHEFVDLYAPWLYRFARRRGLQHADAADLTQDVFRTVARSIGSFDYDSRRGSFRGWLLSVARSRLHDSVVKQSRQPRGTGDTETLRLLDARPCNEDEQTSIEEDYRKYVFEWAAKRVRDEFEDVTWQAFWQTNVEGKKIKEVAESLQMTVGAVYAARSRVLARLKRQIEQVEQ